MDLVNSLYMKKRKIISRVLALSAYLSLILPLPFLFHEIGHAVESSHFHQHATEAHSHEHDDHHDHELYSPEIPNALWTLPLSLKAPVLVVHLGDSLKLTSLYLIQNDLKLHTFSDSGPPADRSSPFLVSTLLNKAPPA